MSKAVIVRFSETMTGRGSAGGGGQTVVFLSIRRRFPSAVAGLCSVEEPFREGCCRETP